MRTTELANIFAKRYHSAADKEGVLSIHLFGIEFAEELKGQKVKEICEMADVPVSYVTEIYKGMRLARYVELKR